MGIPTLDFDVLLAEPPRPDAETWYPDEPSRFGAPRPPGLGTDPRRTRGHGDDSTPRTDPGTVRPARPRCPQGTTLLEASAGTGKTFTIAALATRYIAEGRATIDQLLMITFGRSATRELRERVREALTARATRCAIRSPHWPSIDPVIRSLAAQPDQRAAAVDRLARATADFDSGTIATTHQFCLQRPGRARDQRRHRPG